jgi:TRAP-type uncharacterized transport system fused permease subunit
MFILYFGMMSMITPPVALCAFTAAAMTGASPISTAFQAMKLAWVAYIVPFLFVVSPTLLFEGEALPIATDIATACFGVYFISSAVVGHYTRPLNGAMRLILTAAGLAAMLPAAATAYSVYLNAGGIAIGVLLLIYERMAARRIQTAG